MVDVAAPVELASKRDGSGPVNVAEPLRVDTVVRRYETPDGRTDAERQADRRVEDAMRNPQGNWHNTVYTLAMYVGEDTSAGLIDADRVKRKMLDLLPSVYRMARTDFEHHWGRGLRRGLTNPAPMRTGYPSTHPQFCVTDWVAAGVAVVARVQALNAKSNPVRRVTRPAGRAPKWVRDKNRTRLDRGLPPVEWSPRATPVEYRTQTYSNAKTVIEFIAGIMRSRGTTELRGLSPRVLADVYAGFCLNDKQIRTALRLLEDAGVLKVTGGGKPDARLHAVSPKIEVLIEVQADGRPVPAVDGYVMPAVPANHPVFAMLGGQTRRHLFDLLASSDDPMLVSELAARLEVSGETVRRHLYVLESHGMVQRGEGRRCVRWVAVGVTVAELDRLALVNGGVFLVAQRKSRQERDRAVWESHVRYLWAWTAYQREKRLCARVGDRPPRLHPELKAWAVRTGRLKDRSRLSEVA